ncbi:MAG: c-type cytochrome [Gemmatimonadales bacterium]
MPGRAWTQEQGATAHSVLAGSRAFGSKGCVRCHAINGLGGREGPDLGRSEHTKTFYDVGAALWNHVAAMTDRMDELGMERPHLTPEDVGSIAAFLFWAGYFEPPGNPRRGRAVFEGKRCIVCHQVGSVGGVVGPNLDRMGQSWTPIQIAAAMWNHGPRMAEMMRQRGIERPGLSAADLDDLLAFLKSSRRAQPEGTIHVLPGRPAEGERLFQSKRCIECHGAGGEGTSIAPPLVRTERRTVAEFAAAMWNKAPTMTRVMASRGITQPQLSPDDMADIVAYLYSFRYFSEAGSSQRGRLVLRTKRCLRCHSVEDMGGDTAPNLSNVRGLDSPAGLVAALWNHVLLPGETTRAPWSPFRAADVADLAAYFQAAARSRR